MAPRRATNSTARLRNSVARAIRAALRTKAISHSYKSILMKQSLLQGVRRCGSKSYGVNDCSGVGSVTRGLSVLDLGEVRGCQCAGRVPADPIRRGDRGWKPRPASAASKKQKPRRNGGVFVTFETLFARRR